MAFQCDLAITPHFASMSGLVIRRLLNVLYVQSLDFCGKSRRTKKIPRNVGMYSLTTR